MRQLFDKASRVIGGRGVWEQKQRLFYAMRHEGLRRRGTEHVAWLPDEPMDVAHVEQ